MDAQISALIRNILISVGSAIAVKYGIDSSMVPTFAGVIMAIIGFVWSAIGHTKNSMIASVAALPEVQAVVANSSANSATFVSNDKVMTTAQAKAL